LARTAFLQILEAGGIAEAHEVHHQQIIWDKGRTVLMRTLYWFQHEPCWFVRKWCRLA
jgi:hypothetical protein